MTTINTVWASRIAVISLLVAMWAAGYDNGSSYNQCAHSPYATHKP
jgi:hypothetical protein